MNVANNNRANTVLEFFKLGVDSFHLPSRVRRDRGMVNVDVANYMIASRSTDSQWNFHSLSSMGHRSPLALWSEGVMSNSILLDEVCDSAHLGIDLDDLVPEG